MAAPPATAVLRVRLFARFADLVHADHLDVPVEGIRTVGDLLAVLRTMPSGAAIADTALVAVNLTQARSDTPISSSDEIALLPPLAGG